MEINVLTDRLTVSRLPATANWPTPPGDHTFYAAVRTSAEISVVSVESAAPVGARTESDWRALEVVGPLDFAMVGVMASLTAPLADVDVSVFVISTYDTDYLMVHAAALERAITALRAAGHTVHAG